MAASGPGAIIVGAHVNGLTVARALAAAAVPVVALRTRRWDMAHVSRAVAEAVDLRTFPARPRSLDELLESRRSEWSGWAVYPTDDQAAEHLLDRREPLQRLGYRLIVGPDDAVRTLLNKDRASAVAARLGVPLPRDYGPAAALHDPASVRFPVVLKPNQSHRFREAFPGRKAFFASDAAEFADARRRLAEARIEARVLDFIPGPDSLFFNYSVYMDVSGEPLGGFPMRKERKTPPVFGVCRVAHTNVSAERAETMREAVVAVLRAVGYRGMANAEFKLDERDGSLRLMEINVRPFLMQGLPLRAGIAYARMAWQEAVLGRPPAVQDNGWRGAWIHLHADIGNAIVYRNEERLRWIDYSRPYRMPKTFAVWSVRDPAPFLRQWGGTLAATVAGRR